MAKDDTPNAKRLKEENRLENFTELGLAFNEDKGAKSLQDLRRAISGDTGYGTSRSAGARQAAADAQNKVWRAGNVSILDSSDHPSVRQARREAAAEERRESRGFKKGGKVPSASRRADGIATKGKTKGRFV